MPIGWLEPPHGAGTHVRSESLPTASDSGNSALPHCQAMHMAWLAVCRRSELKSDYRLCHRSHVYNTHEFRCRTVDAGSLCVQTVLRSRLWLVQAGPPTHYAPPTPTPRSPTCTTPTCMQTPNLRKAHQALRPARWTGSQASRGCRVGTRSGSSYLLGLYAEAGCPRFTAAWRSRSWRRRRRSR